MKIQNKEERRKKNEQRTEIMDFLGLNDNSGGQGGNKSNQLNEPLLLAIDE